MKIVKILVAAMLLWYCLHDTTKATATMAVSHVVWRTLCL